MAELFNEVADLSRDARARYLAERDVDVSTQREVEALLAFDSPWSTALQIDIGQVAQRALLNLGSKRLPCGPYHLGDLLGSGGMGAVYVADRADGEVSQRVAVKLLHPGADAPQLHERFLAERQILATLSHPNIARLLDAGHREDGQPYLVMEYVDGKAIDTYTATLGTRPKVSLFLKVCAAVAYLHRNLVVHRDLKPANILVTTEGEPKLLDFGIAKILDLSNDSTITGMRMLTPDYASPEQVAGYPLSTATDVYSLGAVLYAVLTGVSPHRFEVDSGGAIASAISPLRVTPPSKLAPALKGDLEAILMRALRWEPQERYATVEQFSEDLENYLDARPVRARKGDTWYRARRFLRRHWLPAAAAALAGACLTAGVLVANHERAITQRQFAQVRELANRLFDIDVEVRKTPGTTKARELIVGTSLEYLQRVANDVHGDPGLALEVGNAYMRVARVQGVPIANNLGQMDQAEQNLRIASGFVHSVLASQPANRTAILRAAQIAHDRMLLARLGGSSDEALALARQSAEWLETFDAGKNDVPEATAVLSTYLNVAEQLMLGQQYDDALRLCRRAADISRIFGKRSYLGPFEWVSAEVFRNRGDLDEALSEIRKSVRDLDFGAGNPDQATQMNFVLALIKEGRILAAENGISVGRREEAAAVLDRAFTMADVFVHQDPNDQTSRGRLAMAGIGLADILRGSDAQRSLAIYDHVLRHMAEVKNNSSFRRFEVSALAGTSYPLLRLDRPREAKQRLDAAFTVLSRLEQYPAAQIRPGSEADEALSGLANYQAVRGEVLPAIETYKGLLQRVVASEPKQETRLADAVNMSRLYSVLAALHLRAGQTSPASELQDRRLELWRRWEGRLPNSAYVRGQLDAVKRAARAELAPGVNKGTHAAGEMSDRVSMRNGR